MWAKEYLQQLQRLDTVINQKIAELEDLRLKAESVGSIDYAKDKVQTSSAGDAPFVNIIGRMADLKAEISTEIEQYANEKHLIIKQIQELDNPAYVQILYKRYVEFKRFEVIAAEMKYTYPYTRQLHKKSLQNFERTYKNVQNHTQSYI